VGRTVPSFRIALEQEIALWQPFRKAIRIKDRPTFDSLMGKARVHSDAGMLANRPVILDTVFMAILLEQQKEINHLKEQLERLKQKNQAGEGLG
jgi:hypothetical protein